MPENGSFFAAVNSVVSRLGGTCLNDDTWKKIVDTQLFPILSFGSHLWNLEKTSLSKTVDTCYRKGIRRGLAERSFWRLDG